MNGSQPECTPLKPKLQNWINSLYNANMWIFLLYFWLLRWKYICYACHLLCMCTSSTNQLFCSHNSGISLNVSTFEVSFGTISWVVITWKKGWPSQLLSYQNFINENLEHTANLVISTQLFMWALISKKRSQSQPYHPSVLCVFMIFITGLVLPAILPPVFAGILEIKWSHLD